MQLLAALYDDLEGASLHPQTEVDGEDLQVDTVARQRLDVGVVNEADAVEVDNTEVRGVTLDLTDVDHFVDLFFFLVSQLKRSWWTNKVFIVQYPVRWTAQSALHIAPPP